MNILQIFDQTAPLVSGYSMRSRYISESLVKLGVKVRAVSSPQFSYEHQEERLNGVSYMRTKVPGWEYLRKVPFVREATVVQSVKNKIIDNWSNDIKIIDAHSSLLNGMIGVKLQKRFHLPFLYEIRALWEDAAVDQGKTKEGSYRYNLTRKMETEIIEKADKITVICEGLRKDICERGIDESKVTIIPNGVDTEKFHPIECDLEVKKKYGLENCKVFGFIGTFFEFEGLDLLVKAAKKILEKKNDVKFLIVGGGRHEQYLKDLVNEMGLSKDVIFTGRVNHDEIKKYYSVIDNFIYPRISKRITELVTPLKPLEAMAMEKVVIGSSVGGIKELVSDGENGILFEADNVDDLVERCCYVLDNETKMQAMAKKSRQYVVEKRNWLTICREYLNIFEELGVK
jgi:PEP-CTERM/exosortase A-associated glycosyltransferase